MSESSLMKKKQSRLQRSWSYFSRHKFIYFLMLPAVLYLIIFCYLPMIGIVISFQDYDIHIGGFKSFVQSPWVGFKHYINFFTDPYFAEVMTNTFVLGFLRLIFGFPIPLLFAIMLSECPWKFLKKTTQTISYLPSLLSWVIVYGVFSQLLNPTNGLVNVIIENLGGTSVNFFESEGWIRPILIGTAIWKDFGAGAILFLAAITSVSQEEIEAAKVDGAGRLRRIWNIVLPSIAPIVVVVLIMNISSMLNQSAEQVILFYNDRTGALIEIIDSYVYRTGVEQNSYSYATAVGLFKSLVSLTFVLGGNLIIRRMGNKDVALF